MNVRILPGRACGTIEAPPSKSYAHRLMLCAALAGGESTVSGIAESQDMLATLDCIEALGIPYTRTGNMVTFKGGLRGYPDGTVFPCRESGSTLRFFLPVALAKQGSAVFTGAERLIERGVSIYESLFAEKGIVLTKDTDSIRVCGKLPAGEYTVTGGISSQFVTGLLFALPLLDGDSILRILPPVESRPYIDITLDVLRRFGICVEEREENCFYICGNQHYSNHNAAAEGDWSNAAALLAFNLTGGEVCITGLNENSVQGDRVCAEALKKLKTPEPLINLSDCPDLGPVLFAAAAICGGARFTGTRRLRIKESDRAAAMAEELRKFGIFAEVHENDVCIRPGTMQAPSDILNSHNDHRIVMALALLCSVTGGEIAGAEAVCKSWPDFFGCLSALGLEVCYEAG
ncbi:MAG: 3-phosphoshikimate 1-carboxyvinyltransferase [Eubacteriales bacterium]|nr:3-phosphoshikimate 1-carboxyvinyltransferase [Eubacteriales bacterium]